MTSRTTLLLTTLVFAPLAVHAANLPLLDPGFTIVPIECTECACGTGGLFQFIQNIMNVMISFGVIIMVFIIVWAGFSFMLYAGNPEERGHAKRMLTNAFIGMFITLAGWLIVDFVMKSLYDGNKSFGPWNKILVLGGDTCIQSQGITPIAGLPGVGSTLVNGVTLGGGATEGGGTPTGSGGGSCTPIPDTGLVAIDNAGHKLIPSSAQNFKNMKAAAARSGITLNVSSAYRSPDDQTRAWNNNGCHLVNGRTQCAVRTAAVPCSLGGGGSNHTRGTAVDITLNSGVYAWLQKNAGTYGFYNQLPNDLPHWSDTGR